MDFFQLDHTQLWIKFLGQWAIWCLLSVSSVWSLDFLWLLKKQSREMSKIEQLNSIRFKVVCTRPKTAIPMNKMLFMFLYRLHLFYSISKGTIQAPVIKDHVEVALLIFMIDCHVFMTFINIKSNVLVRINHSNIFWSQLVAICVCLCLCTHCIVL